MAVIKKKPKTPNMIWDSKKNTPLCKFESDVLQTEDEDLIAKLLELGYEMEQVEENAAKTKKR